MEYGNGSLVFLDTHIVVWLYAGLTKKLSAKARAIIETSDLFVSQFLRLELQYLFEIERINGTPEKILDAMAREIGLKISAESLEKIINEAINIDWTRDVFDRVFVAEAKMNKCPLVTADKKIHANYQKAII